MEPCTSRNWSVSSMFARLCSLNGLFWFSIRRWFRQHRSSDVLALEISQPPYQIVIGSVTNKFWDEAKVCQQASCGGCCSASGGNWMAHLTKSGYRKLASGSLPVRPVAFKDSRPFQKRPDQQSPAWPQFSHCSCDSCDWPIQHTADRAEATEAH
jgi:hypothetical protein